MKKLINYRYINSSEFNKVHNSLLEYCTKRDLKYNSVKSGLSRYRKNLGAPAGAEKSAASESMDPAPAPKIPRKKKGSLIVPTYNDIHWMMMKHDHADRIYWMNHSVKNRALIDRVLNWVRDYQTSEKPKIIT